jgi:NAD(P)H-hydrate epimerase
MAADPRPAVWDADALNWLAGTPARAPLRVITPHPGEAGTLLGTSAAAVQENRRQALTGLQARYGGVVVLKGSGSLVSSTSGVPWLCSAGNPGMATAGMGDVLTGIVASLLAQGLEPEAAAAIGVEVHARAGDRVARRGERGLLASDLLEELRSLVNP